MPMRCARWYPALLLAALLVGCQEKSPETSAKAVETPADPEAEIKACLAALDPEDRRRAEQQKFCPVMPDIRLGEMGKPYKAVLKGEQFFVCCKSCLRQAHDEPEKTLAALKELKQHAPSAAPK